MAIIIDMDFKIPSCCNECQMCSCQRIGIFYCDLTAEYIDIDSDLRDADCPLKEVPNETKTNIVVVNKQTNRLLASITDKDIIMANDVEVFNYGNNSPIFTDICGEVYLKPNSFELRIDKENNHDTD